MDEYKDGEGFPADLNEWSKDNFNSASKMFGNILDRTKKLFQNAANVKPENPKTAPDKPTREKVIHKDDVTNLKILLEKAQSVDDFIKNM
jgi:hypothetical protein